MSQSIEFAVVDAHGIGVSALPLDPSQPSFVHTLRQHGNKILRRAVSTVQLNIGYKCDLACSHCHVEAGPKRTEMMTRATCDRILTLIDRSEKVEVVDITGGAPELNVNFRHMISETRARGLKAMDRCNLTVLYEPGQEDTAEFLAAHQVVIVASLPCYTMENVDNQRGKGVFERSIKALKKLNSLGYGQPDSGLELNLVYNPQGAYLPGPQEKLCADYRKILGDNHGICFNELFAITNMPIKRFTHYLRRSDQFDSYMQLLIDNYNPAVSNNVMCTSMISIGYEGSLYDCDFNQMMNIPLGYKKRSLWDIESFDACGRKIALDNHCYGCTCGSGSSCGGSLE